MPLTNTSEKSIPFWEYFMTSFSGSQKGLRKIKRVKSIRAYEDAVREILDNERASDQYPTASIPNARLLLRFKPIAYSPWPISYKSE